MNKNSQTTCVGTRAMSCTDGSRYEAASPIAWFEGLQLLPQHFQSWDRRLEILLRRQAAGCTPYSFGIDRLMLDASALSAGKLRILVAAGQFPDGLLFDFDSLKHGNLEFDFKDMIGDQSLRLALAVPVSNFESNSGSARRYRQYHGSPIADEANRDERAVISSLVPILTIKPWDVLRGDYTFLPLIEIALTPNGFAPTAYHPPAISIMRNTPLATLVAEVSIAIRAAAERVKGYAVPEILPGRYENGQGWILSCLISALPELEGHLARLVAHPHEIHMALLRIAGGIAAIAGVVPPYFSAYEHNDPAASIGEVARFILANMPALQSMPVAKDASKQVEFQRQNDSWNIPLPEGYKNRNLVVTITFHESLPATQVTEWLDLAMICLSSQARSCRERRIRGLTRRLIDALPEYGLVSGGTVRLLQVDGLEVLTAGDGLIIDIKNDSARAAIAGISLLMPND